MAKDDDPPQVLRCGWCDGKFVVMVSVMGAPVQRVSMTPQEWATVKQIADRHEGGAEVVNEYHKQLL